MATGRDRRADNLNERLRGAQRNVVDNDTFNLDLNIDGIAQPFGYNATSPEQASSTPAARRTTSSPRPPRQSSIPVQRSPSAVAQSPALVRVKYTEEVAESPTDAPGSGQRRRVPVAEAAGVTSQLQNIIDTPEGPSPINVSISRPTRGSPVARARLSTRPSSSPRPAPQPSVSPTPSQDDDGSEGSFVSQIQRPSSHTRPNISLRQFSEHASEERSPDRSSPSVTDPLSPPAPKRRLVQPVATRAPARRPAQQSTRKRPAKAKSDRSTGSTSRRGGDGPIDIKVQRFVEDDEDERSDEDVIPFANESGETVVDVLMHLCEETVERTKDLFEQRVEQAPDSETRKEFRNMGRAVEAFRQELESRLLQHSIHLNHWHSLQRRLAQIHREKLELREDILRIKGEREQMALRMEALRMKHEAENRDYKRVLGASKVMFDVDLAVAQGRVEPDLIPEDGKQGEIANLAIAIAQLADQTSSNSGTGGLLNTVRDFNDFLERAAFALESR